MFNAHNLSGLTPINAHCTNSNFFSIRRAGTTQADIDATIQGFNTAITHGQLRYKITLLASDGSSIVNTGWQRLESNAVGIDSSTVASHASSFPVATGLGTNSVSFTPSSSMMDVNIHVTRTDLSDGSSSTSYTHWSGSNAKSLAGVASVSKAHALCLTNSSQAQCDASYGSTAIITWADFYSRDAQGRGFWAGFGGTSAVANPQ